MKAADVRSALIDRSGLHVALVGSDEFTFDASRSISIRFRVGQYQEGASIAVFVAVNSRQVSHAVRGLAVGESVWEKQRAAAGTFLMSSLGRITAPFSRSFQTWCIVDESGGVNERRLGKLALQVREVCERFQGSDNVAAALTAAGDLDEWDACEPLTMVAFGISGRLREGVDRYVKSTLYAPSGPSIHADYDRVEADVALVARLFDDQAEIERVRTEIDGLRKWRQAELEKAERAERERLERIRRNTENKVNRSPLKIKKPHRPHR